VEEGYGALNARVPGALRRVSAAAQNRDPAKPTSISLDGMGAGSAAHRTMLRIAGSAAAASGAREQRSSPATTKPE